MKVVKLRVGRRYCNQTMLRNKKNQSDQLDDQIKKAFRFKKHVASTLQDFIFV